MPNALRLMYLNIVKCIFVYNFMLIFLPFFIHQCTETIEKSQMHTLLSDLDGEMIN